MGFSFHFPRCWYLYHLNIEISLSISRHSPPAPFSGDRNGPFSLQDHQWTRHNIWGTLIYKNLLMMITYVLILNRA